MTPPCQRSALIGAGHPAPRFGLRVGQLAGRTSGRLSLPGAAARGSPHTCHTLGSVTRPGFCGFRRVVVDDARVSDPDSGQVPRFAVGSGRPGRIRSAYRRSVRAAREARAVEPWHEVYVEIGEKLAAIADSAAAAGDAKGLVNVARDLQDVLDLLPVRRAVGVSGESGSGSGAGVLHLLSSEPEMGDTANT